MAAHQASSNMQSSAVNDRRVFVTLLQQPSSHSASTVVTNPSVPNNIVQPPITQSESPVTMYSYRVKVINPRRKRETVVRDLRKFYGCFKSITEIKVRLMEELENSLPETTKFNMGYIEKRSSTKRWICCNEDIDAMYEAYKDCSKKEIVLWCDGRDDVDEDGEDVKGKKKSNTNTITPKSKREEKEDRIKELTEDLQTLHSNKLDLSEVQYRLWARMIENGVHASKETPPQVPMITGSIPQRKGSQKKDTLEDTLTAVLKSVTRDCSHSSVVQSPQLNQTSAHHEMGTSPGKATDIRTKSYNQLSTLKQLYDDCILSREEFEEEKKTILESLKKL